MQEILMVLLNAYIFIMVLFPNEAKFKNVFCGDYFLLLIFIFYFIKCFSSKKNIKRFIGNLKEYIFNFQSASMLILFIVMIVSMGYSFNKGIALNESLRFLSYIILFFIIKFETTLDSNKHSLINTYEWSVLLVCIFGIFQYFTGFGIDKKFKDISYTSVKIASTFTNPNNYGAFLILGVFPIFTMMLYEKNKKKRFIYLTLFGIMVINIILIYSRNAFLGFALGFLVLALIYSRKILIFLIGFGCFGAIIPSINIRIKGIFDINQNVSRIKLWKTAIKMIKDHPIRGVGNGNFVYMYDIYVNKYRELQYSNYTHYPSHNSYLKVASELGLFGVISSASIIIFSLVRLNKAIKYSCDDRIKGFLTGTFASVIAFLFMNISDNLFFVPKTTCFFWMFLALGESVLYGEKVKMYGGKKCGRN